MSTDDDPERVPLTAEQAIESLPDGDDIHTFLNPAPSVIIGADWQRDSVLRAIREAATVEIAGPGARGMGHGLAIVKRGGERVFVAAREEVLARLESK